MPTRRVPPNGRSLTGKIFSRKLNRSISYESTLERDVIQLLDFDPGVQCFEEQPFRISYKLPNHRVETYTPDFFVEFSAVDKYQQTLSPLIIEVKPFEVLHREIDSLLPRLQAGRDYAQLRGWRFKIATELEIRTPYFQNVRFLTPFLLREAESGAIEHHVLSEFLMGERRRVAKFLSNYGGAGALFGGFYSCLWRLVGLGILHLNLNEPITGNSEIRLQIEHNPGTPFPNTACLWDFLLTPSAENPPTNGDFYES